MISKSYVLLQIALLILIKQTDDDYHQIKPGNKLMFR